MKVLMLVQNPTARGPVPKHTVHLVASLRDLGCEVVTHPWGQEQPGESPARKVRARLRDIRSVRRTVRGEHFDVAVVKTAHDWRTLLRDIPVALVLRRRCRPIVLQLHGSRASALVQPGSRLFKAGTATLLRLVDALLVLSTEEQRQWSEFRARPPAYVVKNPFVSTSNGRGSSAERLPQLLFVGRLIREKGVFDVVNALPSIVEKTEARLVVVGEGEGEQDLRALIATLGLQDHVTLTGYIHGPKLADVYRASSVFVLPTSWDEGFPTVLAEAMDAGLPIVTTRIRGAADHLVAGDNALFVAAGDTQALARAILELLDDDALRQRMGSANRERVRSFAPAVVAREYLDVLNAVVRGYSSKSAM
jgi:glycosyltransferase involved in cell wall biosynthesis